MRSLTHLVAFCFVMLPIGCGPGVTATNNVGGVSVKILHTRSASVRSSTSQFSAENKRPAGTRFAVALFDDAGTKQGESTVEVAELKLWVNGKGYGDVAKGDAVIVEGDSIKVNGSNRDPIAATPVSQ